MKFLTFLKNVFVSKFWIKAICLVLALLLVFIINIIPADGDSAKDDGTQTAIVSVENNV